MDIFELGDITLQSGIKLPNAKLAYKTYGQLNKDKSNVVVIPTYYTGTHTSNERYFGSGRPIDPAIHFIVVPNMFGNGVSSSPSNTPSPYDGPNFPNITIYDNVVQQHRLLTEKIGVKRIALVCGWSMGALQTYQWGALYPNMVDRIVPFCGSAKCSPHNYVFLEGVKAALLADNTDEKKVGLKAFGRVYCGWAYSQTWFREKSYEKELGFSNLEGLFKMWEDDSLAWSYHDLLCMLWTWQHADISDNDVYKKDFALALSSIKAKAIVVPGSMDLYFPPEDSKIEVSHMNQEISSLVPLVSTWGHMAGSPRRLGSADMKFLDSIFTNILASPSPLDKQQPPASKKPKILVTGAAGGLGTRIVKVLLQSGEYDVLGTDRDVPKNSINTIGKDYEFVVADLRDVVKVRALLQSVESVIHVAAVPGPSRFVTPGCDPKFSDLAQIGLEDISAIDLFQNNVLTSYILFEEAAKLGIRRVVFSSSAFAMGWAHDPKAYVPEYLPLDEDHPPLPHESYGLSKVVGEDIASMIARNGSNTSFVSLRFTNVIHPERVNTLPWPAPTKEKPSTMVMWAYTDAEDVADTHILALKFNPDMKGKHETFLIAAPTTRFKEPTMDLIKLHFGDKVKIKKEIKGNESIINSEKARKLLGFNPKVLVPKSE